MKRGLDALAIAATVWLPLVVACVATDPGSSNDGGLGARATGTETPRCVAGRSIKCAGPAGCAGFQVCDDAGGRYGACMCEPVVKPPPDPTLPLQVACNASNTLDYVAPENVYQQIPGKWWLCDATGELANVEFTPDGRYHLLTLMDGAFARNPDAQASGFYYLEWYQQQGQPSQGPEFTMTIAASPFVPGSPLTGALQATPAGKLRLGTGKYVRIP